MRTRRQSPTGLARCVAAALTGLTALSLVLAGCATAGRSTAEGGEKPRPSASPTPTPTPVDAEAIDPGEFMDRVIAAQVEARTARMHATGALEFEALMDVGTPGAGESRMTLSMVVDGVPVSARLLDRVFYFTTPDLGEYWISIDVDNPGSEEAAAIVAGGTFDPFAQIADTRDAVTAVDLIGPWTLADGTSVTRYAVTIDPHLVTGETADQLADLPFDEMVYEYAIDDRNRPRELTYEVMGRRIVIAMSGWGEPVDITAPDPALVLSAAEAGL